MKNKPAVAPAKKSKKTLQDFVSILDPNFRYVPSAKTDIAKTWMKHGWTPPADKGRE